MGRNLKYDIIRSGSALFVVFYHYTYRYFEIFTENSPYTMFQYGYLGVPIFFILSGFLISKSLENETSLKIYMMKRFLRIYPTYIICMILTFIVTKYFFITERTVSNLDFVLNFFVISDYIGGHYVDSAYWSLAIEVLFYIIAPVLVSKKYLFPVLIFISFSNIYLSQYIFNVITLFNWINFFFLGYLFYSKCIKYKFIFYVLVFYNIYVYFGIPHLIISILSIILFNLNMNVSLPIYVVKVIQFSAAVSFPLYLLHQNIGYFLIHEIYKISSMSSHLVIILVVFISYFLSYLIHITVEKKFSYKILYGK